jgi:four helix bundle protein
MENLMLARTKSIGIEVIKLVDLLPQKTSSWIVAKQILRCSTSIGANYRSTRRAKSTLDFINKLKIVEEETDETIYWFEVLEESGLIANEKLTALKKETNEILSIIVSSIKTVKQKNNIKDRT